MERFNIEKRSFFIHFNHYLVKYVGEYQKGIEQCLITKMITRKF